MRCAVFLCFAIFHPALLGAQERLVLNADLARQSSPKEIVGGSGSAAPVIGVMDGPPMPPPPVALTIVSITVSTAPSGRKQVQYEFQLTNVGRVSIDVPVSPELDKIFVACRSGREQQAGLVLSYHKSAGASMEILPGTSDWSGCQGAKNSMVALSPGQWISYRGSALLPLDVDLSGTIGGAWLLSDISYRTAPGGLIENSACTLSVNSSHKQLE